MTIATKDKRLNVCGKCKTGEFVWLYFQKYDPHWWVNCKKCGNKTSGIGCAVEELVVKEWNTKNKIKNTKRYEEEWYYSL